MSNSKGNRELGMPQSRRKDGCCAVRMQVHPFSVTRAGVPFSPRLQAHPSHPTPAGAPLFFTPAGIGRSELKDTTKKKQKTCRYRQISLISSRFTENNFATTAKNVWKNPFKFLL
jgi:hypothetical protein